MFKFHNCVDMISIEHYMACQKALAPLFQKIRLESSLVDFRLEAWDLLEQAGIKQRDPKNYWENLEPLWDYKMALGSQALLTESEDPQIAALFPAWELLSTGWRRHHRTDWPQRWHAAGECVSWSGACKIKMVALKTSPIWQALGDGAGGFGDALGNPFPPFAIYSSYNWVPVDRLDARALALI